MSSIKINKKICLLLNRFSSYILKILLYYFLYPTIKYNIPGIKGTNKLALRLESVKIPNIKIIKVEIIIKKPASFSYLHPKANPIKIRGNIVNETFSHKE